MAIRENITKDADFFIGSNQPLNINVTQTDETTPQDMTAWTLRLRIRDEQEGTTLLSKTTADDITIQNGNATNDQAAIAFAANDTLVSWVATAGKFYYDLWRIDSGSERPLTYGDLVLQKA